MICIAFCRPPTAPNLNVEARHAPKIQKGNFFPPADCTPRGHADNIDIGGMGGNQYTGKLYEGNFFPPLPECQNTKKACGQDRRVSLILRVWGGANTRGTLREELFPPTRWGGKGGRERIGTSLGRTGCGERSGKRKIAAAWQSKRAAAERSTPGWLQWPGSFLCPPRLHPNGGYFRPLTTQGPIRARGSLSLSAIRPWSWI